MAGSLHEEFPMRLWEFREDMNGDGAVTITDVGLWLKWFFFYPGDLIVAGLIGTPVGNFLELRPSDFGGGWSFTLSLVSWLFAFVCLAVVAEWSKELESHKLRKRDDKALRKYWAKQKAIRAQYDPNAEWNGATTPPDEYKREMRELNRRYAEVLRRNRWARDDD
jgi:hypothetical protein